MYESYWCDTSKIVMSCPNDSMNSQSNVNSSDGISTTHPSATIASSSSTNKGTVAVSLGKPSLRVRLEAYYSLIAPEVIATETAWRTRFEQIWTKFGGTDDGERKLAAKLANKYGWTVRLLVASSAGKGNTTTDDGGDTKQEAVIEQRIEDWYNLTKDEMGSGNVCFLSNQFDPVAALSNRMTPQVDAVNPWIAACPILDRVDQFRTYLPPDDPQYRRPAITTKKRQRSDTKEVPPQSKPPTCFASIANHYQTGPLSILYEALVHRHRIRVVIRYVNGIRGTLTGNVLAFDKHMNLILKDVEENYTPRFVTTTVSGDDDDPNIQGTLSNVEMEVQRRMNGIRDVSTTTTTTTSSVDEIPNHHNHPNHWWSNRHRHMAQIMVRGDTVVLVYRADQERSAWPVTSKSPPQSMYRRKSCRPPNTIPPHQRIGTPGSLIYALQRRQRHQQKTSAQTNQQSTRGSSKSDFASHNGT